MLKRLFTALAAVAILGAQDPAPAEGQQQTRIAVLPLKGSHAGHLSDQGDTVYQMVTNIFIKLKRFEVMERAQISGVLGEGKFQNSGLADESTAVELGKQLGVKYVVLGNWSGRLDVDKSHYTNAQGQYQESTRYTGQMQVNVRMVEVQSGKIKYTFTGLGKPIGIMSLGQAQESMMKDLDRKLDRAISNEFPLTGYILKAMSEKEFLIDLGKADGLKTDDEFVAIVRGESIVHPRTGALVPGEKTVVAEFKVTKVDERTSVVKLKKNEKNVPFKPGMELEQKPKEAGLLEKAGGWMRF